MDSFENTSRCYTPRKRERYLKSTLSDKLMLPHAPACSSIPLSFCIFNLLTYSC